MGVKTSDIARSVTINKFKSKCFWFEFYSRMLTGCGSWEFSKDKFFNDLLNDSCVGALTKMN